MNARLVKYPKSHRGKVSTPEPDSRLSLHFHGEPPSWHAKGENFAVLVGDHELVLSNDAALWLATSLLERCIERGIRPSQEDRERVAGALMNL